MKHNHKQDDTRNADLQLVPVRFEFTNPTATTVCVAGTFNEWYPRPNVSNSPGAARFADADHPPEKPNKPKAKKL